MKTRLTALLLCAALLAALGVNAATPERAEDETASAVTTEEAQTVVVEEEAPAEEETEGALGFHDLRARMMKSYYPLLTLEENIQTLAEWDYKLTEDDLRDAMSKIADQQWSMTSGASAGGLASMNAVLSAALKADPDNIALMASQAALEASSAAGSAVSKLAAQQLQVQYDACKEAYDKVRDGKLQSDNEGVVRQLRNLQDQTVIMAETLFITCKSLAAQDAALTRTVASLERRERELTLRHELGQVSALTLEQVSAGLVQAKSGQKTLRMNLDNILLQLKAMCGAALDEPLSLGALPRTTAELLNAMNLERDLAAAREKSYELYDAKKARDDAKDAYDDARKEYGEYSTKNEWMQAKHTWQAAQYTYENAQQSFELRFRALYAQVKDAAQVLDAKRAAVALQEKSCAADSLRCEQGTISANALADARDQLAEAKDAAASAERDLFTQYQSYENAVVYGILNS